MVDYEQVALLAEQLSLAEKVRLLERLSSAVKHDLELEAYKHIPWEQFLNLTYGSLENDPVERNQPLHPDARDEIE